MRREFMFTSESVTDGHPDKLCDQISDAIVGRILRQDPMAVVVAECAMSTGIVFLAAGLSSDASIDFPETARDVIQRAGYDNTGFDVRNCTVMTSIREPERPARSTRDESELSSEEIDRIPVTDQATVFGYACNHTPQLMPAPVYLAHRLARRLSEVREQGVLPYLAPDGKTQVGVEFQGQQAARVHSLSIVASQKEAERPSARQLADDLRETVIAPVFENEEIRPDARTAYFINPFGAVVGGGPSVHAGLTGRKTAVDTYGEFARSSSSALSGKDPARIDRVGNYAARYAAKNVVAAGLARECEIQLSYSIGQAAPVSLQVETFDTERIPERDIAARIERVFDFRLAAIIRQFELRHLPGSTPYGGFYEKLASYGQVGRDDLDLPWERLDRVEQLRE